MVMDELTYLSPFYPQFQPVTNVHLSDGTLDPYTVKKNLDICPAISGCFLKIQLFLDICPMDNYPAISGQVSRN